MKKGLFILIGIFAFMILLINFASAFCFGSNTAYCGGTTEQTCQFPNCDYSDNSYCNYVGDGRQFVSSNLDENEYEYLSDNSFDIEYEYLDVSDCVQYTVLKNAAGCNAEEGCEWVEAFDCYNIACGTQVEGNCDGVSGCSWVEGSGQYAIADAYPDNRGEVANDYGTSRYCLYGSSSITAELGYYSKEYTETSWSAPIYNSYGNLGNFTYGRYKLPFLEVNAASLYGKDIIIGEPATSGYGSVKYFFSSLSTGAVQSPTHLTWMYDNGYYPFMYISEDNYHDFCTMVTGEIIYYYAFMHVNSYVQPNFAIYADDDAWINFYHFSPATGTVTPNYGLSSDWSKNIVGKNAVAVGSPKFQPGWYIIEFALQEDTGSTDAYVGVKQISTGVKFYDYLDYLGHDIADVEDTCETLECDDFGPVCISEGWDWEYPYSWFGGEYMGGGICCGDDGGSDVGTPMDYFGDYSGPDYICKICEATASHYGIDLYTAGEYNWVPVTDLAETDFPADINYFNQAYYGLLTNFDDDCDGFTDEDVPPPACTPTFATCAAAGVECGDYWNNCETLDCDDEEGCSAGEFCSGVNCASIPNNCDGCQAIGRTWCVNTDVETDLCTIDSISCTSTPIGGDVETICPCVPTETCATEQRTCGSFTDDCGDTQTCGNPSNCNPATCVSDTTLLTPMCKEPTPGSGVFSCISESTDCSDNNQVCRDVNPPGCVDQILNWVDEQGDPKNTLSDPEILTQEGLAIGSYSVNLIMEDPIITASSTVVFSIYEDDGTIGDDFIRDITATTGIGSATAIWTITEADINKAYGILDEEKSPIETFEFYFTGSGESQLLVISIEQDPIDPCIEITACRDYDGSTMCNNDLLECDVSVDSVPEHVDCEDDHCFCQWIDGECLARVETPQIGICTYLENTAMDENGCNDGFLTYGWEGNWVWDPLNGPPPVDPDNKESQCKTSGIDVVPCPAQVELPFFGTWSIVVTIALIIVIYIALSLRKHKSKPKKREKKK